MMLAFAYPELPAEAASVVSVPCNVPSHDSSDMLYNIQYAQEEKLEVSSSKCKELDVTLPSFVFFPTNVPFRYMRSDILKVQITVFKI